MSITESTYGGISRAVLAAVNPVKKAVRLTECKVHQRIDLQALQILKNDGYLDCCNFFMNYLSALNEGVVWADQDFKSIQHFYHPYTHKGAYGQKNARTLSEGYYHLAQKYWRRGNIRKAIFFMGATVHLIQDATIPQHANIRFLEHHKQYERFVKKLYEDSSLLKAVNGCLEFDEIREYVQFNARNALRVYKMFRHIKESQLRFYYVAQCSLPMAERTTAGCLLMFYRFTGKSRIPVEP